MRSLMLTAFLASALLPSLGCNLYFSGGDGEPPPCEWGSSGSGGAEAPTELFLLRNPASGVCEEFGWGGGGPFPCDDVCGPCPVGGDDGWTEPDTTPPSDGPSGLEEPSGDQADPVPMPTWGACESQCTGLEEGSCLATDDCRGIYASDDGGSPALFLECWATDSSDSGIFECEGLDAFSCSTSDLCIAVHQSSCAAGKPVPDGLQEPTCSTDEFLSCHNEGPVPQGCYSNEGCSESETCNAEDICLPPTGDEAGDSVCYGYCVPRVCPPVDVDCPGNTVKVCPQDGCEADCTCEPIDPGECDGDVLCAQGPPKCEEGTTPGIANGCWTGDCIPLSSCPDFACEDIDGESMCIARADCSPYYLGDDCSCDGDGCTCGEWNFDSCDSN